MPKLDLSKPADFSLLTQGALASLNQGIGGRSADQWDIYESDYNGVVFHVFESKVPWNGAVNQVVDTGGRRKVKLEYPYRDGQTTDDLGRMGGTHTFNILFFGNRYMQGYKSLIEVLDTPLPGILKHPIYGSLKVVPDKWNITHKSTERKALTMVVTFIEHSFSVSSLLEIRDTSVQGALSDALQMFAAIDKAIATVEVAQLFVRQVKNTISALLNSYKSAVASTLTQMNATFNQKGSGLGFTDIPSLVPTNQGGLRNADGTLASDTFRSAISPSDPYASLPLELSSTAVIAAAVTNLTKQVVSRREELATIIQTIYDQGGALEQYDSLLELRRTGILLQTVLERGVSSSNASIYDYEVPRVMSLREVAYANGINPNRVAELDLLNPQLLSVNYIAKGELIKVPQ